jgi:UrcA family protein
MKIGFAALAALALVAPAFASEQNPLAADKAVLSLKGLDLASVDGQQRLAIRIDQAARAVCGDRVSTIHLDMESQSRSCRQDVAADIRSRIEQRTANSVDLHSRTVSALR